MRTRIVSWSVVVMVCFAASAAVGAGSCANAGVCDADLCDPAFGASSGSSHASSGSESSSGTGSTGAVMPGCVPSDSVGAVADTCGVFVSSSKGDDANEGTQEKPLKTLG